MYHKPDGISLQTANKVLVTFTFTRHPFERFVSAYFQLQKRNFLRKKHCNFQKGMPDQLLKFAKLVINTILEDLNTKDFMSRYTRPNDCYFLNPLHFIPQYVTCPYCDMDFDLVGKLEDMENDTAFLAQHLGLKVKSVIYVYTYISIKSITWYFTFIY